MTQVNPNLKQQQVSHDQFEALFKKFVDQIKAQFHFPKLDLNTYNEHYIQINNEIRKILKENSVNLKLANIVINAFKKYLIEQENIPDFENNLV